MVIDCEKCGKFRDECTCAEPRFRMRFDIEPNQEVAIQNNDLKANINIMMAMEVKFMTVSTDPEILKARAETVREIQAEIDAFVKHLKSEFENPYDQQT